MTEAAKRAASLLAQGEGGDDLRGRVQDLAAAVTREYGAAKARAEAAWMEAKDRRMVEQLAEIHANLSVHEDPKLRDDQFAEAFRSYGIDVETLDPAEAVPASPHPRSRWTLPVRLDNWAHNRRGRISPPDIAGARRLVAVAKLADPDPWRNRLRDAVDRMHKHRDKTRPSSSSSRRPPIPSTCL